MDSLNGFQDSEQIRLGFVAHEALRIRVTFFIAKKVTKKSSDTKNSLVGRGVFLVSSFAGSLFSFPLAPFSGFMARKGPSSRLRQFRVTDSAYSN
jgi:hypothetical protein